MTPQNVSLWHVPCFELKVIKTQQMQEKLFTSPSPPLNCLKEFRQQTWTRKRAIIRDDLYIRKTSAWPGENLFTKHVSILSSYEFFPFKALDLYLLLLSSGLYKPPLPDCAGVSFFFFFQIQFVFILLICLLSIFKFLDQPKKLGGKKGKIFHPYTPKTHVDQMHWVNRTSDGTQILLIFTV